MSGEGRDAAAAEAAVVLERAVPMLVRWFTRSDVRRSMLADADPALSATDAWLLGRITDTGPVRLSDLADWQEVDRSTMTTQVRRLEDLDLSSLASVRGLGERLRSGGEPIHLGAGEFFGEMALLSGARRSADVTAIDYSQLLALNQREFRRFLSKYPSLRARIDEVAAQRAEMNKRRRETPTAIS